MIATKFKIDQLSEFQVFINHSAHHKSKATRGYWVLPGFLNYAVRHDGQFKARYVAGGCITDAPVERVYSGVISLQAFKTIIFLGKLNCMEPWSTNIRNAYMNVKCSKLDTVVRREVFKRVGLEGHSLLVYKALYGLKSSETRFIEHLGAYPQKFGFEESKIVNDLWMSNC